MASGSSATKSAERRPTVVWVERATFPAIAVLWLESLLTASEVRYDRERVTAPARALLRLLERSGLAPRVRAARLTLAAKDSAGLALNYRREGELDALIDDFCARRLADRPLWYRRTVKSYLCDYLMWRVTFIVMVEAAAAALPEADNVLLLTRHPANDLIMRHGAWGAFRWRQSWSPRGALRVFGAPLLLLFRLLAACVRRPAPAPGLKDIRPSVWVEFVGSDLTTFASRIFWRPYVDAAGFDTVYYLDRRESRCDAETTAKIEARGFRWIDGHKPWTMTAMRWRELLDAVRALGAAGAGAPAWLRLFDFEFALMTSMWAGVFTRFQTRLLIQHQEFSWRPATQARGLERAGGRMIGFHWSEFQFTTEPIHLNCEHLFFVWGRNNYRWLEGKGHDCRHVLPCGVWIAPEEAATRAVKARLAGAAFTLALFDSSYDYNIFLSAEQLSEFLLAALAFVEEQPTWKAALKPKGSGDYSHLPRGAEIMERIGRLSRTGQLVVLEPKVPPMTAALAADLAVCFGLNSAGVVSGAFGARAVHWDCSGWGRHPLYAIADQKLLYPSFAELKKAVMAAAAGDRTIGDFSRWRRGANHFEDTEAGRRVGGWITDYMNRRRENPAEEAFEEAVAAYRREHGVDARFDAKGPWWEPAAASVPGVDAGA